MNARRTWGADRVSSPLHSPGTARWTFVGIAAVLLPVMVLLSRDFGVTWDEEYRHQNGVNVWEFLRGLRSRDSFLQVRGHLYPGLFDTICAALASWVPADPYVLRHMVNAFFGWIGIVYCGRLAGRLFGPWMGVLGMVLLALSPRYFGHSMNNPKDLPFAAMSIMALYYISTASPRWPYLPVRTAIKIAVALGLALNIRVGALVYLGYFGLFIGALVLLDRCTEWRRVLDTAVRVILVTAAMLLLGTLFWPWAGGSPFVRPFQALLGAANYPWEGVVLYAGVEYNGSNLPWHYVPWWFTITTPPVVLLGVALSVFSISNMNDALRWIGLAGVAAFPVVMVLIMDSTLYDGVRHLLFIYPVLVVIAVSGWAAVLSPARPEWLRYGAALALTIGIAGILGFHVRFHPNQVVYFNGFVGGPAKAFKKYDLDYWGNCMLQATKWSADLADSAERVARVAGHPPQITRLDAARFRQLDFVDVTEQHELLLEVARGPIEKLRRFATEPALHRVRSADGAVLCTVTAGPAIRNLLAPPATADGGAPQ